MAAAAELRADDYSMTLADGSVHSAAQEFAWMLRHDLPMRTLKSRDIAIGDTGDGAVVRSEIEVSSGHPDDWWAALFQWTLTLKKHGGRWRATRSIVERRGEPQAKRGPGRRLAGFVAGRARRLARSARRFASGPPASFQGLAFLPHRPDSDYVLDFPEQPAGAPADLPLPPRSLWLGYNYPVHGERNVARMLEIVTASGFALGQGDRVLDFGCGAGRLIRHLAGFADRCEIWGTDISAEHINWCRQYLSPPFHFATTTKVPHLPFEDRSFNLIYCGSVFTHIDDLADAWLLELHRILAPRGRLYLTLHDERTIALFEEPRYRDVPFVRRITKEETYRKGKNGAAMFTVERDDHSQVFYDSRFFARMLSPMFDIVSVTPEAYFYQTAYCLKRRGS
jgi:SAM-dependent methyltransferase